MHTKYNYSDALSATAGRRLEEPQKGASDAFLGPGFSPEEKIPIIFIKVFRRFGTLFSKRVPRKTIPYFIFALMQFAMQVRPMTSFSSLT